MNLIDAMQTANTTTENGMVTNSSTLNKCLDLFSIIGAVRPQMKTDSGKERVISKFEAAWSEDSKIARKIMFWARDVRGGAGEREAFRVLLKWAANRFPEDVISNIHLISEFGRWDDVFVLMDTKCEKAAINLIVSKLQSGDKLLAKWMPRLGGKVSSEKRLIANKVRRAMNMTPKEFRKMLVELTSVVETDMCAKTFSNINYEHVPSVAMARYTKAFTKNDSTRFSLFKDALSSGEAKVNASALYPYDVLKTISKGDEEVASAQWYALPNFMESNHERVLPVCDVSGSMDVVVSGKTTAMDVCISLGLYISERNVGHFKDAFITFHEVPRLQHLTGDLCSRYNQLQDAEWGGSTNLEKTFDLILKSAVKHKVSQDEMPTTLLIMSDMEFNRACSHTALGMIQTKYADAGYTMPKLVFWNLQSRHDNYPVQSKDKNTAFVSGFSPSILKSVLSGEEITPLSVMFKTLSNERYDVVV